MKPERRLLFSVTPADCRMDTFRCPGKGGQNVNKVESGVRFTHKASGGVGHSCDTRDQHRNKLIAWKRMAAHPKFRVWMAREADRRLGMPSPEEIVDQQMRPNLLRVEVRDENGVWQIEGDTDDN